MCNNNNNNESYAPVVEGKGQVTGRSSFLSQRLMPACHEWQRRVSTLGPSTSNTNTHMHSLTHTHTYNTQPTHTHWQIDITCLFCCLIKLWHMKLWLTSGWKGSWKGNLACLASPWHAKYFYHVCLLCWLSVLAINMHTLKQTHTHREREPEHGDVADKATRLKFIGARCRCWAC